jgi:hypothetical protein
MVLSLEIEHGIVGWEVLYGYGRSMGSSVYHGTCDCSMVECFFSTGQSKTTRFCPLRVKIDPGWPENRKIQFFIIVKNMKIMVFITSQNEAVNLAGYIVTS